MRFLHRPCVGLWILAATWLASCRADPAVERGDARSAQAIPTPPSPRPPERPAASALVDAEVATVSFAALRDRSNVGRRVRVAAFLRSTEATVWEGPAGRTVTPQARLMADAVDVREYVTCTLQKDASPPEVVDRGPYPAVIAEGTLTLVTWQGEEGGRSAPEPTLVNCVVRAR
jgi:hypothetical protein